jgi:hypothetical protein
MKLLSIATVAVLLMLTVACHTFEANARDTIAAANGVIVQAEVQYSPTCTSNPNQSVCQTINKAVAAQNAAITALETYCGFTAANQPSDKCQPVKALEPALTSALANLNQFVTELKGATK